MLGLASILALVVTRGLTLWCPGCEAPMRAVSDEVFGGYPVVVETLYACPSCGATRRRCLVADALE